MILSRIPNTNGDTGSCIQIQPIVAGIGHGIDSIVEGSLSHGGGILPRVEQFHLRLVRVELRGQIGREVNIDFFVLLTSFRRNDDDTIGGSRTIDRSRCRIFQHLDALNVVGVEGVERPGCGHAVHDVERVLRGVDGTDAANAHRPRTAGRTIH